MDWVTNTLTQICKQAGVKRMTPYGLRPPSPRSLGERTACQGGGRLVGSFDQRRRTMETYSYVTPAHAQAESEWLGSALLG